MISQSCSSNLERAASLCLELSSTRASVSSNFESNLTNICCISAACLCASVICACTSASRFCIFSRTFLSSSAPLWSQFCFLLTCANASSLAFSSCCRLLKVDSSPEKFLAIFSMHSRKWRLLPGMTSLRRPFGAMLLALGYPAASVVSNHQPRSAPTVEEPAAQRHID